MNKGLLIIGSILAATVMTGCGNKQQDTDGTKADSTQVVEETEKNKIDPASADEKGWQSVAEIIVQKKDGIFKLQGTKNALLGTMNFKVRGEISDPKAKSLAQKAALGKIQPADIVAVYDNKNEGKIVFTDYAMYATEKMMRPIVVKYADITEAGVNRENAGQAATSDQNKSDCQFEFGTDVSAYFTGVNSTAELTANFSLISYDITATSNPTTGGIIDGTGTYDHFSSCTLTATANTGYAFRSWSVNGETVSTDNPYTLTVSGAVELTANFDAQETTTLDNGWTWWSTSIEMSGIDGLTMLEESLGHNGLTIKSANKFVQNYYPNTGYDYWFGQLTSDDFNNESSYMIQTSASCEVTMTGTYANPSDHPIQLYPNWTWIGYPCGFQQSAASAFASFTPTHNDLVKGQYAFSTYYDNYGWFPEFSLTPGQGYMYQSLASDNRTLTFANGSKADPVPTNREDRYWRNNVHAYADNMNVIAVVTISGEEQHGEDIELGAFVNGECRGSAMLKHFQPTDRWYAMLTVTGADGDEIEFGVIDRNRGMASMTSNSSLVFQTNTVVGELDEPYVIDFGTLGCIENGIEEPMHIYPNPIERNTRFTIAFPEAETLSDIFIVNMMGEVVAHETNKDKMTALQTPGVYTVKVVCRSGKVFVGKLVVR